MDIEDIKKAIRDFLEFGNKTQQIIHGGYFAEGGWAHEVLKGHLQCLGQQGEDV